jgi:hypothetical protein
MIEKRGEGIAKGNEWGKFNESILCACMDILQSTSS